MKTDKIPNKNYKRKKILRFFLKFIMINLLFFLSTQFYNTNESIIGEWKKYEYNPILGNSKTGTLFDPYILIDKGLLKMYLSWREKGNIALSISKDGIHWSDIKMVLDRGKKDSWDSIINRADVIYNNGMYHMWYTGQYLGSSKIGYASSKDGYNFTKLDNPILVSEYKFEKKSVMNPNVIYDKIENKYKMWYAAGETMEPDVICYATSKNGINWKKYKDNPIFTPNKNVSSLDFFKIGGCDVHKLSNNKYVMFYIGYSDINTARIFIAESKDGINNWKRSQYPIVFPSKNKFDSEACYKPAAFYYKKIHKWMLYYNGRTNNKEYIGLVTKNNYQIIIK